jgi:hypothetical protein
VLVGGDRRGDGGVHEGKLAILAAAGSLLARFREFRYRGEAGPSKQMPPPPRLPMQIVAPGLNTKKLARVYL